MNLKKNSRVGFSDHTLSSAASYAAAAMGSELIEKHFTLSKKCMVVTQNTQWSQMSLDFCSTLKQIWRIKNLMLIKII